MVAILLFAFLGMVILALVLARYGRDPAALRAPRGTRSSRKPRISQAEFHTLCGELLGAMGLWIADEIGGDPNRLVASRSEPFSGSHYIIFLEPDPPGDVVQQSTVIELLGSVRNDLGSSGLLLTPYDIDVSGLSGLDPALELIDGERMRQLVKQYLFSRLPDLDRYAGFGDHEPTLHPEPRRVVPA